MQLLTLNIRSPRCYDLNLYGITFATSHPSLLRPQATARRLNHTVSFYGSKPQATSLRLNHTVISHGFFRPQDTSRGLNHTVMSMDLDLKLLPEG